jgi:hypothetical protein
VKPAKLTAGSHHLSSALATASRSSAARLRLLNSGRQLRLGRLK